MAKCFEHHAPQYHVRGECFPGGAAPIEFCHSCDSTSICSSCLNGFDWNGQSCISKGAQVVSKFRVAAPPDDGWEFAILPLFRSILENRTHFALHVQIFDLVLAPPPASSIRSARRLRHNIFSGKVAIQVASDVDTGIVAKVLRDFQADPASIPFEADESSPQILSVETASLLCPGSETTVGTDGSCDKPDEPGQPGRFVFEIILGSLVLLLLLLSFLWGRKQRQSREAVRNADVQLGVVQTS
eukprot:TRINITY_DN18856_c0_g4_i1.p1 TRINITY_DN18856_c0_g4~~TRINITY_DN18856_c0_g4_i1.p1  ORF type:complete len:250 (+),score=30.80 TRINITY_DN18856_c0_g4_i1:24-752(+)